MAAGFTVVLQCLNCGHGAGALTLTNVTQATKGTWGRKPDINKCPYCGANLPVALKSIAAVHSGNVGSNTTITLTMTEPGTVGSAVS
jgi:hypothetical protein